MEREAEQLSWSGFFNGILLVENDISKNGGPLSAFRRKPYFQDAKGNAIFARPAQDDWNALTEQSGRTQPRLAFHSEKSTHQAQVQKREVYLHLDIKAHVGGGLQT